MDIRLDNQPRTRLFRIIALCCITGGLVGCGGNATGNERLNETGRAGNNGQDLNTGKLEISLGTDNSDGSLNGGKESSAETGGCVDSSEGKSSCSSSSSSTTENLNEVSAGQSESTDITGLSSSSGSSGTKCQNTGENKVSCSSVSTTQAGETTASADAEAVGDFVAVATSTSENQSSSSSSSSSQNQDTSSGNGVQQGRRLPKNGAGSPRVALHPVGDTGFYVGVGLPDHEKFRALEAKGKEKILSARLVLASEKCDCATMAEISGSYGFVEIGAKAEQVTELWGAVAERFISDDGIVSDIHSQYISIQRPGKGNVVISRDNALHSAAVFSLDSAGRLKDINRAAVSGFFNQAAGVWVHFKQKKLSSDKVSRDHGGSAFAIGLRLPERFPDLEGKRYRLYSISMGQSDHGVRLGAFGSGFLNFHRQGMATIDQMRIDQGVLDYPLNNLTLMQNTLVSVQTAFSTSNKGALQIDGITVNGGRLEFNGFISANGDIVILRSKFSRETGNELEIGLVIGVRV